MDQIRIIKTLPHTQALFIPDNKNSVSVSTFHKDLIEFLKELKLIKIGEITFSKLLSKLDKSKTEVALLEEYRVGDPLAFSRKDHVEEVLDFRIKGDIIIVWFPGYEFPHRFSFFGEECESIDFFDIQTNRKIKEVSSFLFPKSLPFDRGLLESVTINQINNDLNFEQIVFVRKIHTDLRDYSVYQTDFTFPPLFYSNTDVLVGEIKRLISNGFDLKIRTNHPDSLSSSVSSLLLGSDFKKSIGDLVITTEKISELPAGFISEHAKFALLTDREIFGNLYLNNSKKKSKVPGNIQKLLRQFEGEVEIGEHVVHEDYGLALYNGVTMETTGGIENEYLHLEFAEEDQLLVPIEQVQKITKYLSDGGSPKLTKLGSKSWKTLKKKVKEDTLRLAKDLIEHYAKREMSSADAVDVKDSDEYESFVEAFPYNATEDQIKSINEIISDLGESVPMNRLLVGDVGFGKTEVALRAAFKMMEKGGQVLFLSPTTILASQHYKNAVNRFLGTSFEVGYVSRFNTPSVNREIIKKLNDGKIQLMIGTHRLLSSDVQPEKVELVIIDEEQKFGVKQKEKLKKLNYGAHVLSVSATPIPRTLSLALSTIQDISIISTPPVGRNPIETEIIFNDWNKVAKGIENEIKRNGQTYFIHNRVETIAAVTEKLKQLVPGITFRFAHGQMSSNKLKSLMNDFHGGKFDCLVATSIIENGLDLSNVNTMIIHDAHKFGLSQLYQLRGRVGRSERQAYCYLMAPMPSNKKTDEESIDIKNATDDELKRISKSLKKKESKGKVYMERLEALVNNRTLGSGFAIASKDLELRGAGNILGSKQSGHISTVGYALYIEMLANEIEAQRNLANFDKETN